jgi:hypothetical protein
LYSRLFFRRQACGDWEIAKYYQENAQQLRARR